MKRSCILKLCRSLRLLRKVCYQRLVAFFLTHSIEVALPINITFKDKTYALYKKTYMDYAKTPFETLLMVHIFNKSLGDLPPFTGAIVVRISYDFFHFPTTLG